MLRTHKMVNLSRIYSSASSVRWLQTSVTPDAESAKVEPKESKRLAEFRKKLRETSSISDLGDQPLTPPAVKEDPLPAWPDNKNPHTGEVNGPRGPEPTRYGDWERKGRVSDF